jgi:hypothetical protein
MPTDIPTAMSVTASVQAAHDALLARPEVAAVHNHCALCSAGTEHSAKEGASVSDTTPQNVYSEAQHFALLTSAIERETASLAEAKKSLETQVETLTSEKAAMADELSGAKAKVDVLEAEVANAKAEAETVAKEYADFKADLERAREIEARKSARVERVKAANANLPQDYFSQERAARWAAMVDEVFDALVADLTEAAAAKPAETPGDKPATELAKESAAFTGGETPKAAVEGSTLTTLLGATRRRRLTA